MYRKMLLLTVLLAGLALLTGVAAAEPDAPEATGNFLINEPNEGVQAFTKTAVAPDGSFVVTWGLNDDVVARRFSAAGAPLGPAFAVHTPSLAEERYPAIGMDAAGNFIIVYSRGPMYRVDRGIFGQRFNAAGAPVGGEFPVDTHEFANYEQPAIAVGAAGDFVVVWQAVPYSDPQIYFYDLRVRRFNAAAQPLGSEQYVAEQLAPAQSGAEVARDAAGNFVVAWTSYAGPDGNGQEAMMRRFAANGTPLGGDVVLNATLAGDQSGPQLVMRPAGDFLVAWIDEDASGRITLLARPYTAAGAPAGPAYPFDVMYNTFWQMLDLARVGNRYIAVWNLLTYQTGDLLHPSPVVGRFLTPAGPDGGYFPIAKCRDGNWPAVASNGTTWVTTWSGYIDPACLPGSSGHQAVGQINRPTLPGPRFVSVTAAGKIGNLAVARGDIVSYNPVHNVWEMVFDASDLNLRGNLTAFDFMDDDSLLLVYDAVARRVPDIGEVRPQQIIRFQPQAGGLGPDTTGTLTVYLDGRQVGLTTLAERIDALDALPNGDLLISTYGSVAVPGVSGLDEDILRFHPTRLGDFPTGTWTMEFDGSAAGVVADLNGLSVEDGAGHRYVTFQTAVNLAGGRVLPGTILRCAPQGAGCNWSVFRDLRADGLPVKMMVDGLEVLWP